MKLPLFLSSGPADTHEDFSELVQRDR
ncbi:MAG: hypothetical protein JWQ23_3060, partial [Herminiimonas sp.]|nr:hypothetical protein [Herminiimonas sp.]